MSFNKTEYYVAFNIVLNLIFFYFNIEHLKFNTIDFFYGSFLHRHVFSNSIFFVLNSLTANIQFFKNTASSFQDEEEFRNIKFNI